MATKKTDTGKKETAGKKKATPASKKASPNAWLKNINKNV